MLRVTGSIILLGAIARAAPSPVLPKNAALNFFNQKNNRVGPVGDEEEGPDLPEEFEIPEVPVPSCSPSAAQLAVGTWKYVPNSKSSATSDVWFTFMDHKVNWNLANAACEALGNNFYQASIITKEENAALKGIDGGSGRKTWSGGFYDASTKQHRVNPMLNSTSGVTEERI